ncbi:hypothetical protein K504DRAFT_458347 [Pleomassaria siparia CBS 279.74]|uniref:Zn(2)-C6 fungal-type domain-containing protein n=1 Tax=Pleomassaria siparia CBS 279.74 TaxID=1314801 RepID=A0A6G1K4S0_9PLEO|nr:hypothetical protein K504DRAFT_458347 [Pleomassaria siparia CBS 279.74]
MPSDDARKRKACQACTRAKAKCSPFGDRLDLCYRCQRLNKECVFDESARKRGPKTRSRVKQLEQRVESLIGFLGTNGHSTSVQQLDSTTFTPESTTRSTILGQALYPYVPTDHGEDSTGDFTTPSETPDDHSSRYGKSAAFDPIEAGIIDEECATDLLNRFRDESASCFPFVLISRSDTVATLRRHRSFLFLAIMTIMTFETPMKQQQLAEEFKGQIASQIIGHSMKSLEILQGLLVYAAWYHFFYQSKNQQLAITLQLCVAMAQDLNLTKGSKEKEKEKERTRNHPLPGVPIEALEESTAEKRAFLGTYFLTAAFSQAFRKGKTMGHTKYMTQCCKTLAERQEEPTDVLISPLIRLSEMMGRINDHFSYDDIDGAEIKGDMVLEMSMRGFRSELDCIKSGIPPVIQQNRTLKLYICLLDMWIHECCLHSSLWTPYPDGVNSSSPTSRTNTLAHALQAMKTYLNTLLDTPQSALYHLSFPCWSGWFYAVILACKLVFLSYDEDSGHTSLDAARDGLNQLLPDHFKPVMGTHSLSLQQKPQLGHWDPVTMAKDIGILHLFARFMHKMEFTLPPSEDDWKDETVVKDPLFNVTCLQNCLLHGFNKKMKEYTAISTAVSGNSTANTSSNANADADPDVHTNGFSTSTSTNGIRDVPSTAQYMQSRTHDPTPNHAHAHAHDHDHHDHHNNHNNHDTYQRHPGVPSNNQSEKPTAFLLDQMHKHAVPGMELLHFNSLNFDSVEFDDSGVVQAVTATRDVEMLGHDGGGGGGGDGNARMSGYDDWTWEGMMHDFRMPDM